MKKKENLNEILGILGGMGPLATAEFYQKIINKTDAKIDQDHLDIFISSLASTPDRTQYILNNGPSPVEKLVECAKKLEHIGATYIAMPCNTSHFFYNDVIKHISIPFLNMIEETAKHIKKNRPTKKILLLATKGTVFGNVYKDTFNEYDLKLNVPDYVNQNITSEIIDTVKGGNLRDLSRYSDFFLDLERQYIIILGCTELSVAKDFLSIQGGFIDPLDVLVESVLKFANKKIK